MGMSTHVFGIKPPDEKWLKMKAIWDSCEDATIEVPDEVMKFFEYDTPDEKGVVVNLKSPAIEEWSDNSRCGFEVYVDKLPKDITIIRFYNSW